MTRLGALLARLRCDQVDVHMSDRPDECSTVQGRQVRITDCPRLMPLPAYRGRLGTIVSVEKSCASDGLRYRIQIENSPAKLLLDVAAFVMVRP